MPPKGSKILLDQSVPLPVHKHLVGFSFSTAYREGWSTVDDGNLLTVAERAGFRVFVTADQNIKGQQNLTGRKIGIVALGTNDSDTLVANAAMIIKAIQSITRPGKYVFVNLTTPKPKRP